MGDAIKYPALPDLSEVDFSSAAAIRALVRGAHDRMFGVRDDGYIDAFMDDVDRLFHGHYPGYQAMDTAYHDITHTLQATLCLVELIFQRHETSVQPGSGPMIFAARW